MGVRDDQAAGTSPSQGTRQRPRGRSERPHRPWSTRTRAIAFAHQRALVGDALLAMSGSAGIPCRSPALLSPRVGPDFRSRPSAAVWMRVPRWRQCRSEGRAAETPEIVPRRSRRERGRRRLLLWASSSHGACWCEPPAFRASSLLAVVASLPCTRSMHVRVRPIVAAFDWAGVLAGTEDTAALGACVLARRRRPANGSRATSPALAHPRKAGARVGNCPAVWRTPVRVGDSGTLPDAFRCRRLR